MSNIAGVIFAGGRGTRLGGVVKANIQVEGASLVDRVCESLIKQSDLILLSIGQFDIEQIHCSYQTTPLPDPKGVDMGPVGGLVAAVDWSVAATEPIEFLLTVAVDTPRFPSDFLERAKELLTPDVDVVMGAENDDIYPTNALWRLNALKELPRRVKTDREHLGLRRIIPGERQAYVTYSDATGGGSFHNINTQDEMTLFNAKLGRQTASDTSE